VLLVRGGAPMTVQTHVKDMEYWDREGHVVPAGALRALRLRSPEGTACVNEVAVRRPTIFDRPYSTDHISGCSMLLEGAERQGVCRRSVVTRARVPRGR
jgi:hypothetical protein